VTNEPRPNEPARRQSPRVALQADVSFADDRARRSGSAVNIGLGGMCVGSSNAPPLGSSTVLTIALSKSTPVPFAGTVKWVDSGSFGVEFETLSALQLRLLVELLKQARIF
jgi:hypothetical protein